MTAPALKPGTRCECRGTHSNHHLVYHCMRKAVRMVMVAFDKGTHGHALGEMRELAYCAPCAEYHEARQKGA